jgi:hypothetical protein
MPSLAVIKRKPRRASRQRWPGKAIAGVLRYIEQTHRVRSAESARNGTSDKYRSPGLFMGEASVLNAGHERIHDRSLDMDYLVVKRSGWRPLVCLIAVAVVRQLTFYARWITYSCRADKVAEFLAIADRFGRLPDRSKTCEIKINISYFNKRLANEITRDFARKAYQRRRSCF